MFMLIKYNEFIRCKIYSFISSDYYLCYWRFVMLIILFLLVTLLNSTNNVMTILVHVNKMNQLQKSYHFDCLGIGWSINKDG